jgi:ABC-type amino acid transport substrate-binding protein
MFTVRMRSRDLFPAALVLSIALVLLAGCSAGNEETFEGGAPGETTGPVSVVDEEITVASNMAYRPFEFSPRGGPEGFDIDLMNEIADRVGFEVRYENVQFDEIVRGVHSGLYDASISAMTITAIREQQVDFSDPYFNADQALMVASYSDVESVEDLSDEIVGVQQGTAGQIAAQELINAGTVGAGRTYRTIGEAFAALHTGQVDGVVYDLSAAQEQVENSEGRLRIVESVPTGEQYGIAFPEDSDLVEPVNEALAEIKADGTYEEIYERWIGLPPEEIP